MESPFPSQIDSTKEVEENKLQIVSEHKQIISTFPRTKGWSESDVLIQYQGFWFVEAHLEGIMSVKHHNFQANPGDIILASCPKTGTTWLKALLYAIVTRKRYDDSTNPLLVNHPHDCIPLLEVDLVEGRGKTRDPEIPFINTHVPYSSLPNSIIQQGCKIVYIWRDAKDTFISYWHFVEKIYKSMGNEIIPLKEAFELFCQGISAYGPYWDHVLSYHKARMENPDRILFLKYEEMMEDTEFYVKKLAEFVGCPFNIEEEGNRALEKVIKMCSFEKLSNLEVNKSGNYRNSLRMVKDNMYFRKAKVGDWSSYLTPEMGERLDLILEKKLKGSGLAIMSP